MKLCQDLTKRPLMLGLPSGAIIILCLCFYLMITESAWWLLLPMLIFAYVVRRFYAFDAWAVGGLLVHISMTLNNRTKLHG